jgi:hypothetical protein
LKLLPHAPPQKAICGTEKIYRKSTRGRIIWQIGLQLVKSESEFSETSATRAERNFSIKKIRWKNK